MKPLLVTSGEPAGVGPDICLALAGNPIPLVVLGDKEVLRERASRLALDVILEDYQPGVIPHPSKNRLLIWSIPCDERVIPGQINCANAPYVMQMLTLATDACLDGTFSALVTAPVHKAIINEAGIPFTGHTEFLAMRCQVETVVMLMVSKLMRVALVTTHIPLSAVANAMSSSRLTNVLYTLHQALERDFGIKNPTIKVAGLNPHAGEGGHLGREEIEIISPVIESMKQQNMMIEGPFPADTLFVGANREASDAFVAMYHDQGLPVIKYADFEETVNVTLGLPIIRTSVDHGTALSLAGTGCARADSLNCAVELAHEMATHRAFCRRETIR